ncbi:type II toxin-antitoxin system HicA family toxin [uncultured Mobiluncus sp.]|uniref:type II toxin-antitoxin system HicA family toxin n=1 Tax=uncultured Mobiluncus sp. TaxID=293425 RepID=UPI00345CD535
MLNSGFISQLSAAGENVLLWLLNFEQFCLAALLGVVHATVPNHPGKDIPPGTLRNIEKQLEPALGKG